MSIPLRSVLVPLLRPTPIKEEKNTKPLSEIKLLKVRSPKAARHYSGQRQIKNIIIPNWSEFSSKIRGGQSRTSLSKHLPQSCDVFSYSHSFCNQTSLTMSYLITISSSNAIKCNLSYPISFRARDVTQMQPILLLLFITSYMHIANIILQQVISILLM